MPATHLPAGTTGDAMPASPLAAIAPLDRNRRAQAVVPMTWVAAFSVAVTSVVVIAAVSLSSVDESREAAQRVATTMEAIDRAQRRLTELTEAETGQRGYLLTGEASYLDTYQAAMQTFDGRFVRLRELLHDDPGQIERLDAIAQLSRQKLDEMKHTIELQKAGRHQEALQVVQSDRGKAAMDGVRAAVAALIGEERQRLEDRQQRWQGSSRSASLAALVGAAVLLALTIGVTMLSVREHRRREDELWIRRTHNALGQHLQGDLDEASLATKVLTLLTHALMAPAASLYTVETDGRLRRTAVVGASTAGLPETLAPGEGWAGQVARDGVAMHLRELPSTHLGAHTTLGHTPAAQVFIAAARHEGRTQGVIELGFLGEMGPVARELIERVSELVGAALHSAQRRRRLEDLLRQTQRQAEELQAQQEELRVSNEELEERGRVLSESQAELETQQAELERVNGQLSQHSRALEQQRAQLLASQAELRHNAQALEATSRYKSEFLANMSHELRTPLNSSLILSRLLVDNKAGTLGPEQVRWAHAIHDANNDLLALINDILDLSKIEAGHADLQAATVSMPELLQRLRAQFEPQARSKGLGFAVEIDAAAPTTLHTDGQRLAQVLKNLLANAMKFTARGDITLALAPVAGGGLRIEVHDTGIGIAADKQQVIFEAFRQADGSTSRLFGGTGLGLSISRELVQRMGGRIEVNSTPGQGSVFAVELPLQMPEQPAVPMAAAGAAPAGSAAVAALAVATPAAPTAMSAPPSQPPAAGPDAAVAARAPDAAAPPPRPSSERRVVLAVEDDADFADVLRDLVQEAGFDCVVATDGQQALQLARELRPAGVLLDVGLPDVSGLSVLERLKRDPATRHIPVHIVSAGDRSQPALQMGAIGHLVKPALREELVRAIEKLRDRAERGPRRLLIVEDDAELRRNLELLLAAPDVAIDTVGTVADAQQALARSTYDCMVTDLALPDASGFELLERMAADSDSAFPPVIVYTGRALTRDEETLLRRHSRSIIVKGARSPERLLDEVTLFLHSVESGLGAEQQRLLKVARQRDGVLDGRRILLAEDDVRNIFALTSVFEPLGVQLEVARNGREALARLQRKPDIDLVLMDVMMPEMDGLTAMRRIRESAAHESLPIIALTAKARTEDRRACLDAGANDYLSKPIDIDRLVSLCRVWMPQ